MKHFNRREFLGTAAASPATANAAQNEAARKRVLITSGYSRLAQMLAGALATAYRIRLTERIPVRTDVEFVQCDLAGDAATAALLKGVSAIVHVAEPLPDDADTQRIDYLTHRIYNLLMAAAAEKVPRLVYLSTLELMSAYDPDFTVSERFRPLPGSDASRLAKYMGECVCREFAREGKMNVTVLRLGKVVRDEEVQGAPADPTWVDERDVAGAVAAALTRTFSDTPSGIASWAVFHIASESRGARFSSARAVRELHYQPQYRWDR